MLLAAMVVGLYGQTYRHQFINYDDDRYVTENPNVNSGLRWANVQWAFVAAHASNWHPLTWLSHQLDVSLFGLQAGAHHLMNVGLHVVNTWLLFFLMRRLTGAFWRSALVAALFALHPLHVESVAWVAERKDLLSAMFGMLSIWAYAWYVERPGLAGWRRYSLVWLLLGPGPDV